MKSVGSWLKDINSTEGEYIGLPVFSQPLTLSSSEPQYKKRLRLWRLEKCIPKRKIVHLLKKSDQRLAQGKRTECIFNGHIISIEELDRSRYRYREDLAKEPMSPAACKFNQTHDGPSCLNVDSYII